VLASALTKITVYVWQGTKISTVFFLFIGAVEIQNIIMRIKFGRRITILVLSSDSRKTETCTQKRQILIAGREKHQHPIIQRRYTALILIQHAGLKTGISRSGD
jgi:hypothetical protein